MERGDFVEIAPTSEAPSWVKENSGEVFVVQDVDEHGAILDNGIYCNKEWLFQLDAVVFCIESEKETL